MYSEETKKIKALACKIRLGILDAVHSIGSGHVGGALSITDVLAVLYGSEMKYDPQNPKWEDRDKLVCSKGHAGPAVYSVLAIEGFFPKEELLTLNKPRTNLPSHCDRNKTPGVDMTAGSLGQGISCAAGMALGDKLKGRNSRTFVIVGDGESNEGQVWEAIMFASAKKLSNFVLIIDWNKRQLDGATADVLDMGDYSLKLQGFGFNTVLVKGSDVEEIQNALEKTREGGEKPYAIILDSVKGAGIPDVEKMDSNHSISVSDEQYEKWTAELKKELAEWEA